MNRSSFEKYPPLLRKLLLDRDVKTVEEAEAFLNPDFQRDTHDPFLLSGMQQAVARVLKAVKQEEHIVLYSDYDMDGIPGAVVLSDFFRHIGYERVTHYVPDRNTEGFGLNVSAIKELANKEAALLITIDCGIRAVEPVKVACTHGIDVIITDHHIPDEVLPDAYVVVNPNLPNDTYPNKHLCGAGVAFKFVQALTQQSPDAQAGFEKWSLDMVAAATISDMVPLLGENRALVHFGLIVFRKSRRPGVVALCRAARVQQNYVTEDDIMFSIAPRINAASRMGEAGRALELLLARDSASARDNASYLEKLNRERKGVVASMVRHIKKHTPPTEALPNVLVIGDPRWQPGMLGLVAQRAVELYERPVCVWGRGDAPEIKGSCRSDGSINVVSMLESAQDILTEYGGHEYSGGFSVPTEEVHVLRKTLSTYSSSEGVLQDKQDADADRGLTDVNWETYREIERLAPFGMGNPKPVFLFRDIEVAQVKRFGTGATHIELAFEKPEGGLIKAIRFFADKRFDQKCKEEARLNVLAQFEQSFFTGRPELRLRVVDIL